MAEIPLISVIIPVYNASRYLCATLDSILAQSYPSWEILCIDDGSTDSSAKIIKEYAEKDHRIFYIHQQNAGPGAARNHGLEIAKGNYIVFQDSDDALHLEAFQIWVKSAEKHHADVVICGFQSCNDDLNDADWNIELRCKPEVFTGDLAKAFEDSQKFRGHPWGKLYRRDVIGEIRFNDLRSGEDTYFNIDIAAKAKCMVILPLQLYFYRQVKQSLTHSSKHHSNTIEAGQRIGLHCIDLYNQKVISQEAMLALVQQYGTNSIMLHLLLIMDDAGLTHQDRCSLLNQGKTAINTIKHSMPFAANCISPKYLWIYRLGVRLESLSIMWCFSLLRRCLLNLH